MLQKLLTHAVISLLVASACLPAYGKEPQQAQVFYHNYDPTEFENYRTYELDLILLALEKTVPTFGPYEMQAVGVEVAINQARSIALIKKHNYPNYVRSFGFQPSLTEAHDLHLVPFPLYLGAMSYRVCFTSKKIAKDVARVKTVEELKKFRFGTGIGWSDASILRHNGFKVTEINTYDSLFKMTAINRSVDLFCRGSGEVELEAKRHKDMEGLVLDRSIALYYLQPLFLYMNKADSEASTRIQKGLELAYKDGSLQKLWRARFKSSIDFSEFEKRKIFRLENPFLKDLNIDFEKYNFIKFD